MEHREIEKKYLVKSLPDDIDNYPYKNIEQAYINEKAPTLRVRRLDDEYIFTYKNKVKDKPKDVCASDEIECILDEDTYKKLLKKASGCVIKKRRYLIPYEDLTIELDVFFGEHKGLVIAEVEFDSFEQANDFSPPSWFFEDVSSDYHYSNSYLAFNF